MNGTLQAIVVAFFVSAGFASWPVLASRSGLTGTWSAGLACAATLLPVLCIGLCRSEYAEVPRPSLMMYVIAGGLLNGLAVYFYTKQISSSTMPTASFMALVSIGMLLLAPIFEWALKGLPPSPRQMCGYAVACLAVWLITGGKK
jgi:drug/metabolite transporter (DMT)-like permease